MLAFKVMEICKLWTHCSKQQVIAWQHDFLSPEKLLLESDTTNLYFFNKVKLKKNIYL